jgi:hypothetical protein
MGVFGACGDSDLDLVYWFGGEQTSDILISQNLSIVSAGGVCRAYNTIVTSMSYVVM